MFFWEILAFVIVFPTCWWLGGRMARAPRDEGPHRPEAPDPIPTNVIDLAEWRRRHSQRLRNRATR